MYTPEERAEIVQLWNDENVRHVQGISEMAQGFIKEGHLSQVIDRLINKSEETSCPLDALRMAVKTIALKSSVDFLEKFIKIGVDKVDKDFKERFNIKS